MASFFNQEEIGINDKLHDVISFRDHLEPSLQDDAAQQAEVAREGLELLHEALGVHVGHGAHLDAHSRLVPRGGRFRAAQSGTSERGTSF